MLIGVTRSIKKFLYAALAYNLTKFDDQIIQGAPHSPPTKKTRFY